ncbi:MAG: exo-beta-N-acetylmuramidase NamZ domain-containing protein [Flavobacteriaceae bacterium]
MFAPEHGFRGTEPNGANINDEIDSKTGLRIISLHGENRKYGEINDKDLENVDIIIFDIQDVGVRFYTHISTLHYVMESSAKNNIPIIILDRPNPNNHYIDGPVLNLENRSFVGMHEVPIVYGLTIGEYAKMINGEGWLKNSIKSKIHLIELKNYNRNSEYDLPIIPSPNLPNKKSINLYPSLCLFEGTNISAGRGTNLQFQIYGSPYLDKTINNFNFKPIKNSGSKFPKHENKLCYGKNLKNTKKLNQLNLSFILRAYKESSKKSEFFNNYFIKLAGVDNLKQQIIEGYSEDEIKQTWQKKLDNYKLMRKKYLIYE